MLNKLDAISFLLAVTLLWVFLSVVGSLFKATGNCGAEYPIGTILHTNLFCELENEQDND
tara:strand:+ start:513 stop:692 length:180 start_codon:yes stop_codon:yes gene_type:complete